MRSMILAAMLLARPPSLGATALAQEKKGDPAPETQQATAALKAGRYEDSIRYTKMALGRDERYVPAMIVMAKDYYHLKKYELATSIVDIAKSIDPNNAEAYNLLGFIALTRDPPDRISATAAFKKATQLKGDYIAAWNNLAAQYLYAKNYDGAVAAAEKAASLAPNFVMAQVNLGSAYRGKQRYADADRALKQALKLDPNNADAFFNLGILYLDAKEMPGMDLITKLNASINYLSRYKQVAAYRLTPSDPVDTFIQEARTGIEREQKRIERQQRNAARNAQKAAQPAGAIKTGGDK